MDRAGHNVRDGLLQRWLLTVALALMFGLSQQGALVHEISHFDDVNPLSSHHDEGSYDQNHDHDKSGHAHYCEKCVSFSALASSVGAHFFAAPLLANSFDLCSYRSTSHSSPTFLSYAARAPPE